MSLASSLCARVNVVDIFIIQRDILRLAVWLNICARNSMGYNCLHIAHLKHL